MAESKNTAVLDCSYSKTVCSQAWFDTCIETLSNEDKSKITYDKSNSINWFGDGKKIPALENAKIPALISSQTVMIDTDIVSNESMKRENMHLNFQSDTLHALGQTIKLIVTKNGHYAVPFTLPVSNITLNLENSLTKNGMACKLHRQFAHASSEKLFKLLKSAGKP